MFAAKARRWVLWGQSLVGAFLGPISCGAPDRSQGCLDLLRPAPLHGPVLAEVGGTDITAEMVSVLQQGEKTAAIDSNRLMETLEDRVRFELLAQAAWRENFGNHPEVLDAARKVMVRRYLQAKVPVTTDARSFDSNVLLRAYLTNRHLYQKPEVRRLDFVSFPPGEASAQVAKALLASLSEGIEANEALQVAVRAGRSGQGRNHPSVRFRGPAPKWVSSPFRTQAELTSRIGSQAASQIFALEPGAYASTPIATPRGLWVVRVAARRADLARSLEEVTPELLAQLTRERRAKTFSALVDTLRARIPVAVYPERAQQVLSKHLPATRTGGIDVHAAEISENGELSPGADNTVGPQGS